MKWRTKYLINPQLQFSVLGVAFGLSALSCLMIYGVFASYFSNLHAALDGAGIRPTSPLFEYLLIQQHKMESMLFYIGAFVCVLNTVILTIVTHRIAGPVYRIHKSIEALLSDKANFVIRVRKGDFFSETADLLEKVQLRGLKDSKDLSSASQPESVEKKAG